MLETRSNIIVESKFCIICIFIYFYESCRADLYMLATPARVRLGS